MNSLLNSLFDNAGITRRLTFDEALEAAAAMRHEAESDAMEEGNKQAERNWSIDQDI